MPAILAIACLVGLVWGCYLVLRGSIVGGCVAYLLAASCLGFDFWHFDVAGISMSVDRLLLIALVVAYVVQWRLGRTQPKEMSSSEKLLVLFTLLLVVSTVLHGWHVKSPGEIPIVQHLINGYLIPVVLYWIARRAEINRQNVAMMSAALVCFGIYLAVTSLFEVHGAWTLVFPKYIADPDMGIHFGRARGPFLQSARLGTFLITCLVGTCLFLLWRPRWGRPGQLLALVLVPLYACAIYFTYTRSVWLGAAVAGFVLVAFTVTSRWKYLVIGSMFAASLLFVVSKWDTLIALKREHGASETRESTYMRANFAYVSWLMFKERPISGYGFGQFPHASRPFLGDRQTGLRLESIRGYVHHNTFLCILVELGVVGLLLYCALLASWCRTGWQLWYDPRVPDWVRAQGLLLLAAIGGYSVQMMFHNVTHSPVENGCIFLLAGIASGLNHVTRRCPSLDRDNDGTDTASGTHSRDSDLLTCWTTVEESV